MRLRNFQMIEDCDSVAHDVLVTVGARISRHIGGFVPARGVGDAAIAFAEFAELRLPAAMVAGKLVHEQYRRAASNFLVIEADLVWCDGIRHCRSTLWPSLNLHRKAHQFSDIARADPLHHPGSMILHGLWADLELGPDFLVRQAGYGEVHNLALSEREGVETSLELFQLCRVDA